MKEQTRTKKGSLKRWLSMFIVLVLLGTLLPGDMLIANGVTYKTPFQIHGALSVKGAQVLDQHGNPFQLRGISSHGINWDVGYPYINQESFKTLRDDWGANAVRLAMYTVEYNGYCTNGADQEGLKRTIDNGVQYAKNLGMYAIIDWHVLNDHDPNVHIDEAKKFWTEISNKYKNEQHVLYEICNEPNNTSNEDKTTWDEIKAYANVIIPIIRKNDPDAIIIVGTPTYSQLGEWGHTNEVADDPLTGYSNIVYTLHFYCAEDSHTQYLPAKVNYAVAKNLPVFVSEFGLSQAYGGGNISTTQADAWLKLLDEHKISYFCWSLSNKDESSSLINHGCTKTSGWSESDLSTAGQYIRTAYRARRELVPDVPVNEDQVEAFVARLYEKTLGRAAEPAGKEYWKKQLVNRVKSGAEVGYGFVFSTEYQKKNTTDEEFIRMMYTVFMDRDADAAGLKFWKDILTTGVSREYVYLRFATSDEYKKICESYGIEPGRIAVKQGRDLNINLTKYVVRIYTKALGRSYDVNGVNYWCNAIYTKKVTPQAAAEQFILSKEFTDKKLSDAEYIKVLYRTFMDREADQAGLTYWTGRLSRGETRKTVLRSFAGCEEFKKIIASFGL